MALVLNTDTGVSMVQDGVVNLATDVTGTLPLNNMTIAGSVIQVANYTTGVVATGTTITPLDDTIPQNTEGNQYMSLAFTPKKANSKLKIDVVANITSTSSSFIMALFRDSGANALGATVANNSANYYNTTFTVIVDAVSTSLTTFSVRIGGVTAGTITFNGLGGARQLGGSLASSITITEIAQ